MKHSVNVFGCECCGRTATVGRRGRPPDTPPRGWSGIGDLFWCPDCPEAANDYRIRFEDYVERLAEWEKGNPKPEPNPCEKHSHTEA